MYLAYLKGEQFLAFFTETDKLAVEKALAAKIDEEKEDRISTSPRPDEQLMDLDPGTIVKYGDEKNIQQNFDQEDIQRAMTASLPSTTSGLLSSHSLVFSSTSSSSSSSSSSSTSSSSSSHYNSPHT